MIHDPQIARHSLVLEHSSFTCELSFIHIAYSMLSAMILAITITVIIIDTIIVTITNIATIIPPAGISILSPWLAMMITVPRRLT